MGFIARGGSSPLIRTNPRTSHRRDNEGVINQRQHLRFQVQTPCTIKVVAEREYEVPAVLLDVSEGGVALLSPEFLDPGTLVSIRQAAHSVMGEVRNCQSTRHGFRTGVEVTR